MSVPSNQLKSSTQEYWAGDPYDEHLHVIHNALASKESMIALTGKPGVGKTALCLELKDSLEAKRDCVIYFDTPPACNKTFQQSIAAQHPQLNVFAFMVEFEKLLCEALSNGHKSVLIIDNAHLLSIEVITTIRIMSNLQTDTQRLLQVILSGQPSLYDVLAQTQCSGFVQRLTHRRTLLPMSKAQLTRLLIEGYSVQLSAGAMSLLTKISKGMPGIAVKMAQALGQQSHTGQFSKSRFIQVVGEQDELRQLVTTIRLRQSLLPGIAALILITIGGYAYLQPTEPSNQIAKTPDLPQQNTTEVKAKTKAETQTDLIIEQSVTAEQLQAFAQELEQDKTAPEPSETVNFDGFDDDPFSLTPQKAAPQKAAQPVAEVVLAQTDVDADANPPVTSQEQTPVEQDVEKKTEQTTAKNAEPAPVHPEVKQSIEQAVQLWLEAWQAQDVDNYFATYTGQFTPDEKTSNSQWRKDRMMRIIRPRWIQLEVESLRIMAQDDHRAALQVWLSYSSPDYKDRTLKQLEWVKQDQRWLIFAEQNLKLQFR